MELEELILAFYLAHGAQELNLSERFHSHHQLIPLVEDKVKVGMRRFDMHVTATCENVARAFVDLMIEREALSGVVNNLGTAYRSEPKTFRAVVKDLQDANPIVQRARNGGPDFWQDAFAAAAS